MAAVRFRFHPLPDFPCHCLWRDWPPDDQPLDISASWTHPDGSKHELSIAFGDPWFSQICPLSNQYPSMYINGFSWMFNDFPLSLFSDWRAICPYPTDFQWFLNDSMILLSKIEESPPGRPARSRTKSLIIASARSTCSAEPERKITLGQCFMVYYNVYTAMTIIYIYIYLIIYFYIY